MKCFHSNAAYNKQACLLSQILWYEQLNSAQHRMMSGFLSAHLTTGAYQGGTKGSLQIPASLSWLLSTGNSTHLIPRQQQLDKMSPLQRLIYENHWIATTSSPTIRNCRMKAWLSSVLPVLMAWCQGFQLPASAWLVLLSSHFKEFSLEVQHETLEFMRFSKFISTEKHFWIL